MLVPRGAGVTVSAGVLENDPWADQDGVGDNDIAFDCERLRAQGLISPGFTAAIVNDHDTLSDMMDWYNSTISSDAEKNAGYHVAGAITGAQGRRPLFFRDATPAPHKETPLAPGAMQRCEGVLLLHISPNPTRVRFTSRGHVGNALLPEVFEKTHLITTDEAKPSRGGALFDFGTDKLEANSLLLVAMSILR
jgi:hypothetical protein